MRFFLILLLSGFLSCPSWALEKLDTDVAEDITVLADPSFTVPLTRIARRYGELYNTPVSLSFGSSKDQLAQVREGLEGNIFITAKAAWMKQLQQEGLMDVYSRTTIARNRLAIVSPLARKSQSASLADLTTRLVQTDHDMLFALGDPEYVAEGTYTFETLSHYKLGGDFEPHFSILSSSYALKNTIANYDAYGAIFYTDAVLYPDISLVESLPEEAHQPILYQAAVIVGDGMDKAREFLNFLKGEEAQNLFRQYGFLSAY